MKKKLFLTLLIMTLLFSNHKSFALLDNSLFNQYKEEMTKISNSIQFIGKNALMFKSEKNQKLIDEYIIEIDSIKNQITSLLYNVNNDYQQNLNTEEIENMSFHTEVILTQYRFALTQLKLYLKSDDYETQFNGLNSFYNSFDSANKELQLFKSRGLK